MKQLDILRARLWPKDLAIAFALVSHIMDKLVQFPPSTSLTRGLMRRLAFALLLALLPLLTIGAAEPNNFFGYISSSSQAERDWETKFRVLPDSALQREYMQRLSARPHHVGSPYDKDNAEWILASFKEWGLDAHIETFNVLFPTPKERIVEMVAPVQFRAKLEEPTLAIDPTSGRAHV